MAKPISNHAQRALPITACAAVTACGIGTRALHDGLLHNVHRLRVPRLFALDFATYVGEVADELPALAADSVAFDRRNARLALAAMQHAPDGLLPALADAVERYGSDRIGVVIGTSTSGMYETEQAFAHRHEHGRFPDHYHFERQHAWNATADFIRSYLQLGGPCYTISTACSSGSKALIVAQRLIRTGVCDAVIAGGVDSLCRLTCYGFKSLELTAEQPCTPLDRDRNGISLGEGGALMLLERTREALNDRVHLLGCGESSDAHHMTAPHPQGKGALLAMQQALAAAGRDPRQIDYVNLHATGTPQNDRAEMLAMQQLFDDAVQCSGTKGLTGHTLGAAGAIEAAICWLSLQQQFRPGTCGLQQVDPEFQRPVISAPQPRAALRNVMCNNFGFGGNNSSLVLGYVDA